MKNEGGAPTVAETVAETVANGWIQHPVYEDPVIPEYRGNPLIEALPPIFARADIARLLQRAPEYNPAMRLLGDQYRWHAIDQINTLLVTLPNMTDIEQKVSTMMRAGYVARNPLVRGFSRRIDLAVERLKAPVSYLKPKTQASNSLVVLGDPGMGKSSTLEAVLGTYPQVIEHDEYVDPQDVSAPPRPFTALQLVYLLIRCPADGSPKALLLAILQAMDSTLETDYFKRFGRRGKASHGEMIPHVATLAARHHLGVLVIDEFQAMRQATEDSREELLNFLVRLIDEIKLPIVIVGGASARPVLEGQIRMARRGDGQGTIYWRRMPNDAFWKSFVTTLWRYQYLTTPTPLTEEMIEVLHTESLGIPDYAVKLFRFAQRRAINVAQSRDRERITLAIIRSVAKDSIRLSRRRLQALRTTDPNELLALRDNEEDFLINIKYVEDTPAADAAVPSATTPPVTTGSATDSSPEASSNTPAMATESNTKRRNNRAPALPGSVHGVASTAAAGSATHVAFQEAGFIRPAKEFLPEQD